jgi:hypothetical protein
MLLHEAGHFILKTTGAFDAIGDNKPDNSRPEYLTTVKKTELACDSLAIDLVKSNLTNNSISCKSIGFDVQLIIPGMQLNLAGRRMIDNFGAKQIGFLHDPSNTHPNLELRITFMNYFLNRTDALRQMIDDYIYNRTVAPVHNQEFDPRIYQGQKKNSTP